MENGLPNRVVRSTFTASAGMCQPLLRRSWMRCGFIAASLPPSRCRARRDSDADLRHGLLQVLIHLGEEARGGQPLLLVAYQQGEILGHISRLHRRDADLLQRGGELGERWVAVELGPMC